MALIRLARVSEIEIYNRFIWNMAFAWIWKCYGFIASTQCLYSKFIFSSLPPSDYSLEADFIPWKIIDCPCLPASHRRLVVYESDWRFLNAFRHCIYVSIIHPSTILPRWRATMQLHSVSSTFDCSVTDKTPARRWPLPDLSSQAWGAFLSWLHLIDPTTNYSELGSPPSCRYQIDRSPVVADWLDWTAVVEKTGERTTRYLNATTTILDAVVYISDESIASQCYRGSEGSWRIYGNCKESGW